MAFEALLAAACRRLLPGTLEIGDVASVSGGASQETWSFTARMHSGARPLILRRAPPGYLRPAGSVALETEADLIRAAGRAGVPVPEIIGVLAPADGLGSGYLMARLEGETIPRKLLRDAAYAEVRPRLARDFGRILARIHNVDVSVIAGVPMMSTTQDIASLEEQYFASRRARPVFDLAIRWLRARLPESPARLRLVHGDFRNGNLMIDAAGVAGVLDWELAHIGDPRSDLGWLCVNSWRFGAIDKPVGGFGLRAELIAGYCEAGGEPIAERDLLYWEALGTLRWGVICLGMLARFESGQDRSPERAMIARRTSETELDLLRLIAPRQGRT